MDPSEPLSKRLPFTSLKTRQWLLLWNCSNRESFLRDTRYNLSFSDDMQFGYINGIIYPLTDTLVSLPNLKCGMPP